MATAAITWGLIATGLTAASGITSAVMNYNSSKQQQKLMEQKAEADLKISQNNAKLKTDEAEGVMRSGQEQVAQQRQKIKAANAKARNAVGASGFMNNGSFSDLLAGNEAQGEADLNTMWSNVNRQRTALLNQAQNQRWQGNLSYQSTMNQASALGSQANTQLFSGLLSTGANAVGVGSKYFNWFNSTKKTEPSVPANYGGFSF